MTHAYPSMMGTRLRKIRRAHGTSLRALADTVGVSAEHLSQVESGRRALDRHSLIMALAEALGTSPNVFTTLPVPAPGNGGTDSAIEAVRQALLAVSLRRSGGQVTTLDALHDRATATAHAYQRGEGLGEVGRATAQLIRDLHSSIDADRDPTELRQLAVRFHANITLGWLRIAGVPVDLRLQAANLAYYVAKDLDTPAALGLAAYGGLSAMIGSGLLDLARAELDDIDVPATDPESTQLAGMLMLCRALLAAMDSRPAEAAAMFDQAERIAERTGEGDAFGMGFGPTIVGLWRMYGLLDVGDYAQATRIGAELHPLHPLSRIGQADYWVTYARALARMRGRRDHAIQALLNVEELCTLRLYRDPFARDLIAELLTRSPDETPERELHDLARRAGLLGRR